MLAASGAATCAAEPNQLGDADGKMRVVVMLRQKGEVNEQTTLGFAHARLRGLSDPLPILPQAGPYHIDDPPAVRSRCSPDGRVRVEVLLPEEPTQIAVDPDQVLIDNDPANNFWKPPVRFRFAPIYTFLEETDLTNYYDRWNVIAGPWMYGSTYDDPWYTRSTMVGLPGRPPTARRISTAAPTQPTAPTTAIVVVGADALWDHVLDPNIQVGLNAEHRLTSTEGGDEDAVRGVAFARYIFMQQRQSVPAAVALPRDVHGVPAEFLPAARRRPCRAASVSTRRRRPACTTGSTT